MGRSSGARSGLFQDAEGHQDIRTQRWRGVEEERGGSGVTNRLLYLEWLNNTVPLYRDFNNRESPLSIL